MHALREHWPQLEADFTRFCHGADLRALCWGESRWGVRRLLAHVQNLPRDSAFSRKLRGDSAYWDETPLLLASVIDVIKQQTYALLSAWGAEVDPPEPFPRPGIETPQPNTVGLAEFASFL